MLRWKRVTASTASDRVYNVGEPNALTETEWVQSIGRAAGWNGEVVALYKELMPEGLLEALPEKDATDLLAYLRTLK